MNSLTDLNIQSTFQGVFRLVAPEIALLTTACVVFLVGCFYNRRLTWWLTSLGGVVSAAVLAVVQDHPAPAVLTVAPIIPDEAASFVRWVALISAAAFLFVSWAELADAFAAEYCGCLLVMAAGVSLVGRSNDLITLFVSLELVSIPTYILLYLPGRTKLNQEAAAKYFLLSILSSAFLLFGFSYLYGLAGGTNITVVVDALAKSDLSPMALLGMVMVVAAVGFRITAVPFHFYAPDVYEGGPAGVIAQLAFLPKVAGFAALVRLLGLVGEHRFSVPFGTNTQLPLLLWILAILTMCLGNVLALLQDNVRRMLAYSGVAHAGYMLMGVIVASSFPDLKNVPIGNAVHGPAIGGVNGLLVYLAAYGMMTVGAFAVILYLSTADRPVEGIDDLAGLGKSHPLTAWAMTVFMLSLIGMPLTAGFIGKFLLFVGAFTAPSDTTGMGNLYRVLAVVAAINAAIGAVYYLRVIGVMFLRTPLRPIVGSRAVPTLVASLALAAATVVFGVYPEPLWQAAFKASPAPPVKNQPAPPIR